MRKKENNIPKSPLTLKVQSWRRKISIIATQITAALFLDRADDMLSEHAEVILRNEAWEEAKKRSETKRHII